jgi:hypothetical protein
MQVRKMCMWWMINMTLVFLDSNQTQTRSERWLWIVGSSVAVDADQGNRHLCICLLVERSSCR